MPDETVKQTMLMVADVCDRFAIGAAMCSIYELALSHVIDETERELLMLREGRLLGRANPLMRLRGWALHIASPQKVCISQPNQPRRPMVINSATILPWPLPRVWSMPRRSATSGAATLDR
jgi:hypothetical protein